MKLVIEMPRIHNESRFDNRLFAGLSGLSRYLPIFAEIVCEAFRLELTVAVVAYPVTLHTPGVFASSRGNFYPLG